MSGGPGPVAERTSFAGAVHASTRAVTQGVSAMTQAAGGITSSTTAAARQMTAPQMPALAGPSRNERNNKMVLEVALFSRQVQLLYTDVSTWSAGIDAGLSTMKAMLDAPLPIPYDHTENGVAAFDPVPHAVGHSVETNVFPKALNKMKTKLADECLNPLAKWLEASETIRVRNLKCHQLGLDVDAQDKALLKAAQKLAKAQEMAPPEPGLTPEAVLEATLIAHQTEEDKLTRLEQRFSEMEASVFNALLDVMRDAQVTREYAAAALVIMQGAVHSSLAAFKLDADATPYMLPPACTPEIKLPNFAAVTIPMASMKRGGLYDYREKLCTKAADPLQAATTDMRATTEFAPGAMAMGGASVSSPASSSSPDAAKSLQFA
ncbi:hypothetical protein FOA52_011817 [Chlamydomonas sp. UWO 241]|nr:hypothetical protein FOA52_011817 [Chlamydomonas sp. UWO 241]